MPGPSRLFGMIFAVVLAIGVIYCGRQLAADLAGVRTASWLPFLLLGLALLIALGFEFVNGFHDTANAVATVIYTHSLPAQSGGRLVRRLELPGRPGCRPARSRSASCRCCPSS